MDVSKRGLTFQEWKGRINGCQLTEYEAPCFIIVDRPLDRLPWPCSCSGGRRSSRLTTSTSREDSRQPEATRAFLLLSTSRGRGRRWMGPAPPTGGLRNRPAPSSILVGARSSRRRSGDGPDGAGQAGQKLGATCQQSPVSSRARREVVSMGYGLGTAVQADSEASTRQ